jgi:hypothetical protein
MTTPSNIAKVAAVTARIGSERVMDPKLIKLLPEACTMAFLQKIMIFLFYS